jgi:uncharacterized protein with von Willebrand factor type A (vWA) domain
VKLFDKARRLMGRERQHENTVVTSKVETAVFDDIVRRSEKVRERLDTAPILPDQSELDAKVWRKLGEDVWSEFYGLDNPTIRPRDRIAEQYRINRELSDKQARDDEYDDLHAKTNGQTLESAIAWLGAMDQFAQGYAGELAEHAERANEIADAERTIDDIDAALESLREQRRDNADDQSMVDHIDELIRMNAQAKREAVGEMQAAVAQQQQNMGSLIDAARSVAAKAADNAEQMVEATSLMPGAGAGPGGHIGIDQMLEFGARVQDSDVLRDVLAMMGRLEVSMGTIRRQLRKGGQEEMVDIETGNELQFVLAHERALLTHPVAKFDFYRRFHERSLMQYEMWSEHELKKGPLIIAADGSGSMGHYRNVFARGLALAACSIANREGRNTAALEFGSADELTEFWFRGDRSIDNAAAMEYAEHFFAGGTNINQVLLRAHDLIRSEAPFHSADLVIITDGGDRLTESTYVLRDKLRGMGVKIHGIAIEMAPTPYLLETCDSVSSVFDFAGPNNASNRLAIDLT